MEVISMGADFFYKENQHVIMVGRGELGSWREDQLPYLTAYNTHGFIRHTSILRMSGMNVKR